MFHAIYAIISRIELNIDPPICVQRRETLFQYLVKR